MTDTWGPVYWNFLHRFAATYPCRPTAAQRRRARNIVRDVSSMLPCPECRTHFVDLRRRSPPDCSSRASLCRWMWAAHNDVNRRLGKPEMSLEQMLASVPECPPNAAAPRRRPQAPYLPMALVACVVLVAAIGMGARVQATRSAAPGAAAAASAPAAAAPSMGRI